MVNNFEALIKLVQNKFVLSNRHEADKAILKDKVAGILSQASSQGKIQTIAQQIVDHTGLNHLMPACYSKFQPLVTESMVFLLQKLPDERLIDKIIDQLALAPDASHGLRLCTLIKDMPSLQKLGQIICRSPGLAPEFKQALINLEDNVDTVTYEDVMVTIDEEIRADESPYQLEIETQVLAEASVCVVVGAILHRGDGRSVKAVLKIVKQHVRDHLAHELEMLDQLALFLDRNKDRWELGDFKFEETLNQVRWLLENEVNLEIEQANLEAAGQYFQKQGNLSIPERLYCSTSTMTVMTRVEGRKITDVSGLDGKYRRRLANALAETCILRPVKDLSDNTLFHGDPHAGNIAYTFIGSKPRIIFYDWGMMGRLNRLERFAMTMMAMGVVLKSVKVVSFGADVASGGQISTNRDLRDQIVKTIHNVLDNRRWGVGDVLADINAIMEEVTYKGVVFTSDLLLFQKALVTLKGVIADVDPSYDNDRLIWIALGSHLRDLGKPRYYWSMYNELVTLGRFSATNLIRYQRLMLNLLFRLGLVGLALLMPNNIRTVAD